MRVVVEVEVDEQTARTFAYGCRLNATRGGSSGALRRSEEAKATDEMREAVKDALAANRRSA